MTRMPVEERRALLVDAAITVMARDGVAHATTRAIVAEAGMQVGMFHYCFRSKEELVDEVAKVIGRRSFVAVAAAIADSTDLAEVIRRATRAYWERLRSEPLEHLLAYELTHYALRQPGHEEVAVGQYAAYYDGMAGLLQRICALAGCHWRTPVDELARLTLAVVDGITFQWLVSRDDPMALRLLDQLTELLLAHADYDTSGE